MNLWFWKAEGRVHLEAASVVWGSGLTVHQAQHLQRVEHRAVAAFSEKMEDPRISCQRLGLEPLDVRRQKLALKFAKRTIKKSRHGHIFTKLDNPHEKIGNVEKEWREPVCRTRIWTIGYGLFGPFMICICVNSLNSTYLIVIHTKSY